MTTLEFGDQVRHIDHPEWGIGSVAKVESTAVQGTPSQKLTIRFPNAGIKVVHSISQKLEQIDQPVIRHGDSVDTEGIEEIDRMSEDALLAPVASRKLIELMAKIPEPCRDPFRSLSERIETTLALWRFDKKPSGLNDWAVMQTGLDDPLARFNRHELEMHFKRWSHEREQHLKRLLQEAGNASLDVEPLLDKATPEAQRIVQRAVR